MRNRSKQASLIILSISLGFWTTAICATKVAFSATVSTISQQLSQTDRAFLQDPLDPTVLFQKGDRLDTDGNIVTDVAFDRTGNYIATVSDSLSLWHRDGTPIVDRLDNDGLPIKYVRFSPDGTLIAVARETPDRSFEIASEYKTVELWQFDGEELQHFQTLPHGEWVKKVDFSPNGKTIATVGRDRAIKVWNLNGWQLKTFPGEDFSFSPDGRTLATTGTDGNVTLWRVGGWILRPILEIPHEVPITRVSFSPDGNTIATTSDDGTIFLWSRDGEAIAQIKGHDDAVNRLEFSSDGRWLTTAGRDSQVRLWHLDGLTVSTFDGDNAFFSPDSRFIAIDDGNSQIGILNLETWKSQSIPIPRYSYGSFYFSPDSQTFALTENFDVQLWDLAIDNGQLTIDN
ncbi:PD40 domain-containing protein [Oscillatoriales cyanobacterium LEGE 11467]|uniref:PD40 domain-containing protein n=1 Tax=Zarconia navalis LEGE 11467 TaxID=1828826 RepID=A0A928ZA44_9CYAN|nr:WD40 repeat domain-containing protein [Zarconia navalis]MBE9042338.1 PD40 domain-containing protein [Zarconia navalis LEGE 11467]